MGQQLSTGTQETMRMWGRQDLTSKTSKDPDPDSSQTAFQRLPLCHFDVLRMLSGKQTHLQVGVSTSASAPSPNIRLSPGASFP